MFDKLFELRRKLNKNSEVGQAPFYLLEPSVNTELCRLCPEEVILFEMLLEMIPENWAEKRKSLVAFRRKNRKIPTLKEVISRAEDSTKKFYANPIKTVEFVKE